MSGRVERLVANLGFAWVVQIALVEVLFLGVGTVRLVRAGDWRVLAGYAAGSLLGVLLWPAAVRALAWHGLLARAVAPLIVLGALAAAFDVVPASTWVLLAAAVLAGGYSMNMACVYSDPRVGPADWEL